MPLSDLGQMIRCVPKEAYQIIRTALLTCKLDIDLTAASLKITRRTLQRMINKLNMVEDLAALRVKKAEAIKDPRKHRSMPRPKPWKKSKKTAVEVPLEVLQAPTKTTEPEEKDTIVRDT